MESKALKLNRKDNVATALDHLAKGAKTIINCDDGQAQTVELMEDIAFGFKFATEDIEIRKADCEVRGTHRVRFFGD